MSVYSNPKYSWLISRVTSGYTTTLGKEDDILWTSTKFGVNIPDQDPKLIKSVILGEMLQQIDDPVAYLKETKAKYPGAEINITVPAEHNWNESYKPFTNKKHKRHYDTDSLAEDLEKAGLKFIIEQLDFKGWSFFVVRAK